MANKTIGELASLVEKLQSERKGHLNAIAEIDAAFNDLGIYGMEESAARPRGRKPKTPPRAKAGRTAVAGKPRKGRGRTGRRFPVSGTQSILALVKQAGSSGVTGGDIDRHWKSEGRSGTAYNILGQLIRSKKLKKQPLKGQRGSLYTAP